MQMFKIFQIILLEIYQIPAIGTCLETEEHLRVCSDRLVDGGEIVQDEILFDVANEFHEGLSCANLFKTSNKSSNYVDRKPKT